MTRAEHLAWCKARAHEELNRADVPAASARANAISSMISDLGKHPETEPSCDAGSMVMHLVRDRDSCIRFIDGFN